MPGNGIGDVGDSVNINQGNGAHQHINNIMIASGNVFPRSIKEKSMIVNYTYVLLFLVIITVISFFVVAHFIHLYLVNSKPLAMIIGIIPSLGMMLFLGSIVRKIMLKAKVFHIKFNDDAIAYRNVSYRFDSDIWNIKRALFLASTLKFFTYKDGKLGVLVVKFINESEAQYVYDWFFSQKGRGV